MRTGSDRRGYRRVGSHAGAGGPAKASYGREDPSCDGRSSRRLYVLAIRYLSVKYIARRDGLKSPPEYLKGPSEQRLVAGSRELRHDVYLVVDKGASSGPWALSNWLSRGACRQEDVTRRVEVQCSSGG